MDGPESEDLEHLYRESLIRQHILEDASCWLLRLRTTERYLKLLGRSLTSTFGVSHAAVLVDKGPMGYVVVMSVGQYKLPSSLVKLTSASPLIHDLRKYAGSQHLSLLALGELTRLHAELCFPILNYHKHCLIGLLTVGPRTNGVPYEPSVIAFFKTLTNDIAVEVEKETYYDDSIRDPLTGLFNRKQLGETLHNMLECGSEGRMAIALLDVDHFKKINDTYGHPAGDQVLRIIAEKIKRNLRKEDVCFRYGGEEFCVLFRDLVKRDGTELENRSSLFLTTVHNLAERLRENISQNVFRIESLEINVTVSIGLSIFEFAPQKMEFEEHFKEADELLYAAKHAGRNRVVLASSPFTN